MNDTKNAGRKRDRAAIERRRARLELDRAIETVGTLLLPSAGSLPRRTALRGLRIRLGRVRAYVGQRG